MTRQLYLITGPSGAGKSTIAEYLTEAGHTAIDADVTPGLCYYVNKNGKPVPYPGAGADASWWAGHNYVWEIDRLKKLIGTFEDNGKPIFLCGNAGNIVKAWSMFPAVFYLDIPATILIKRTSKAPDQPDQLVSWLEPFKAEMLGSGAVLIDATVPVEVAARSILKHIKAGS